MIVYGVAKAIPMQMGFPHSGQFAGTVPQLLARERSLGLDWRCTGVEIFAGCAELLGGILLMFPRTTTLGALVCLIDMTQVFMLNMTYDIPVKLLSFHLILLSLIFWLPKCVG